MLTPHYSTNNSPLSHLLPSHGNPRSTLLLSSRDSVDPGTALVSYNLWKVSLTRKLVVNSITCTCLTTAQQLLTLLPTIEIRETRSMSTSNEKLLSMNSTKHCLPPSNSSSLTLRTLRRFDHWATHWTPRYVNPTLIDRLGPTPPRSKRSLLQNIRFLPRLFGKE